MRRRIVAATLAGRARRCGARRMRVGGAVELAARRRRAPRPRPRCSTGSSRSRTRAAPTSSRCGCARVPVDTRDPTYVASPARLPLRRRRRRRARPARASPATSTTVSHGRYDVALVAGGAIEMGVDEDSHDCVERAIDAQVRGGRGRRRCRARGRRRGAHRCRSPAAGAPPARGRSASPAAPSSGSRRAAYVGASDFHPELGRGAGCSTWSSTSSGTRSGCRTRGDAADADAGTYSSALDLMSDSAAPRDVDPGTLDGPDLIAVDRLALGWIAARTTSRSCPATATDGRAAALDGRVGRRGWRSCRSTSTVR